MKRFRETFSKIMKEDRGILIYFVVNFLVSLVLFVMGLVTLRPDSAVVKIEYGDIGGYKDGTWVDMLSFPIFGILLGVLHSFVAVLLYEKNGKIIARVFLAISAVLGVFAIVILARLVFGG